MISSFVFVAVFDVAGFLVGVHRVLDGCFFELSRNDVFVWLLELICLMLCSLLLCNMVRALLESDTLYGMWHCRMCCTRIMFSNSSCHCVMADNCSGPTLVWFIVCFFVMVRSLCF